MKTSTNHIAQHVGDGLTPTNEERLVRLNLLTTSIKKDEVMERLEQQIERQNIVKSLVTAMRSRHKRSWLWSKRGLTPGNKLRIIEALSGTQPTKVNKTIGITNRQMKLY